MSDPRFTDPRYDTPPLSDPVVRRPDNSGSMWGWLAGIAVLALIGFILVAGWNSGPATTANTNPPVNTASTPMRNVTPPASTTGSGATSPRPSAPAPVTPAPATNDAK